MSTYRITNDDDAMDYNYPLLTSLLDFIDANENDPALCSEVSGLAVGATVTVGGGAAVQFSIERID